MPEKYNRSLSYRHSRSTHHGSEIRAFATLQEQSCPVSVVASWAELMGASQLRTAYQLRACAVSERHGAASRKEQGGWVFATATTQHPGDRLTTRQWSSRSNRCTRPNEPARLVEWQRSGLNPRSVRASHLRVLLPISEPFDRDTLRLSQAADSVLHGKDFQYRRCGLADLG